MDSDASVLWPVSFNDGDSSPNHSILSFHRSHAISVKEKTHKVAAGIIKTVGSGDDRRAHHVLGDPGCTVLYAWRRRRHHGSRCKRHPWLGITSHDLTVYFDNDPRRARVLTTPTRPRAATRQ